jgi:hypothetical protein
MPVCNPGTAARLHAGNTRAIANRGSQEHIRCHRSLDRRGAGTAYTSGVRTSLVGLLVAFHVAGCVAEPEAPPPLPPPPGCESNRVPLITTRVDGVADVQVVPVKVDGIDAYLALDTGSQGTFVFADDYIEDAAELAIGCEVRRIPGYGDDGIGVEYFEGVPILGILGLEFFAAHGEIDYPGGTLARHAALPAGTEALPSAPYTNIDDRGLVDFSIDGVDLRMMFDTGAQTTLWVGVEGDADDEQGYVQMADGTLWEVWFGDGALVLAGETRTVPVIRGLENDYISPELEELGAQGLLGLTSMGWRTIRWDTPGGRIYFGPL